MIAARGDGDAQEEEDDEDQPAPPSPSPPPIVPQGGVIGLGLGRSLLASIRSISGLAPPPGPKLGLGLLLQLKEYQHPHQRHTDDPPSSASSFSDAPTAFEPFEEDDDAYAPLPFDGRQGAAAAEWRPHPHATAGDTCITSADPGKAPPLSLGVGGGYQHSATDQCTLTGEDAGQDCVKQECAAANRPFQGQGNAAGELGATEDGNAVEDQQEGATEIQGAAKDAITVEDQETSMNQCGSDKSRPAEDDGSVEGQEEGVIDKHGADKDVITVEDQEMAADRCTSNKTRAPENDGTVEDQQEGAIDKHGAAKDVITVEDQETSVDQCTSNKSRVTQNDGAAEDHQEGTINKNGAAKDVITVEDQEASVDQCTSNKSTVTKNDGAAEDHQEGAIDKRGAAKDVISVEDQEASVDQCTSNKSRVTKNDGAAEDHQEGVIGKLDTIRDENVVEYQAEVVAQGVIEEQSAISDGITGDDQGKVLQQQCTTDHLSTMDDKVVVVQDVVKERDETTDDIAVEDREKVEQHTIHELGSSDNDGAVEDQLFVEHGLIDVRVETSTYDIAVKDKEEAVEQCATYDLGTTENDDAVDDQEEVEQGVIDEGGAAMDDNVVEGHKVMEQSVINGMRAATDDIAVEDQDKVVEQCETDESRATKDEYPVGEKEKVVEQGIIHNQGTMPMDDIVMKDQEKVREQTMIDNQGTMHMDDIAVKDWENAVEQYVIDAIITSNNENPEEHKVGGQGVINKNGRTKDDTDVEEQVYVKEQVIIDECGTASYGTALEDQKNEAELCICDEHISSKDVVAVHIQENMLEQRISDEQGATNPEFTVEKHKEVVDHVRHEWGATEDDLAIDTAASEGISGISSSDVAPVTVKGSDVGIVKKVKVKLSVGYPRRPRKLNCPFYMSKGSCSYGFSCHFNHPPLKAYSDTSSFSSEQENHGAAEILDLNRIGLPVREGARNCTYYMRNGTCGYGKKCLFNHPEQVIDAQFHTPTGWEDNALPSSPNLKKSSDHTTLDDTSYLKKSCDDATLDDTSYSRKSSDHATLDMTSYSKKSSEHATLDGTSHSKKYSNHATLDNTSPTSEVLPRNILRMLLPPQKVSPSTEGKVMKVKKNSDWSSTSDDSDGCCSADSSDGPLCKQGHVEYPERPGRPECPFYIRFGDCTLASACKYHHSKDRYPARYHSKDLSLGELIEYPERPGEPECPFYMRFGDCKFASACKYHHSKDRHPTSYHSRDPSLGEEPIEYPERSGKPECPFYMKNRFCKFRVQCNFHHPKDLTSTTRSPTNANKSVAANGHHPATRITLKDHVSQQQQYPKRPGQPDCRYYMQFGKCKYLSACIFDHPKDRSRSGCHPSDPAHSDQYRTWQPTDTSRLEDLCQQAQIGPELHGMPECPFYKKTGKCHFGSACEFHHLKNRSSTTKEAFGQGTELAYDNFTRSENVLQQQEHTMYPERPGEPECSHYMKHGSCRFEMNCKYHHPRDGRSKKPRRFVRSQYGGND